MIKQPIIVDLHNFVNGVSNLRDASVVGSPQLVKCSLNLLENLPACRELVFEYFSIVFDRYVGKFINYVDNSGDSPIDEDAIMEIQETLERLVTNGPPAWSPLISNWSLRLLGMLSSKHKPRHSLEIGDACSLWLDCRAIRCLLGLTALCFSKLDTDETEACINVLLSTFIQYAPNFNWVLARLGSCFPLKVIAKILQYGLNGFSANFETTLPSEVDILNYLAHSHETDLKQALNDLFSVTPPTNSNQIIPYILHLADMSDILAQPIMDVFLKIYSPALIETIKAQYQTWPANYNPTNLQLLLTSLCVKTKENSVKLVLHLAKIADSYLWTQELLELIFVDLEAQILTDNTSSLLLDINKDDVKKILWDGCISDNELVQQSSVRLLLLACSRSPLLYQQSFSVLLGVQTNLNKSSLNSLVRLIGGPFVSDNYSIIGGLQTALKRIQLGLANKTVSYFIFKNLYDLIKLEIGGTNVHLKSKSILQATQDSITDILSIWSLLLDQINDDLENTKLFDGQDEEKDIKTIVVKIEPETVKSIKKNAKKIKKEESLEQNMEVDGDSDNNFALNDQIHIIANIIDLLEIGKDATISMSDTLKLTQLTVKYFFWCLLEVDLCKKSISLNCVYSLLSKQCCARKLSRAAAIRDLLEKAIFYYGNFFGSQLESEITEKEKEEISLMKMNQKQGLASNASRTSVLHSGVIGYGPKTPSCDAVGPNDTIKNNFLNAIVACCHDSDHITNTNDGFSCVSLLLVELVSTDVMYNGLPWPDEEFTKVTMERDLQIRRTFKNVPILWSILALIASYRPALCYSSVLLRALCATVLHQWKARSAENINGNNVELHFVTKKLLELMTLGQLLPPPLSYLHIVVDYLEPCEIALVLKECVWNYMRENVPSPASFISEPNGGLHWRDPTIAKPQAQFIDPLRNTMQRKLSKLGGLYYQMFVMTDDKSDREQELEEVVIIK